MKLSALCFGLALVIGWASDALAKASHSKRGYVTKSGTYVEPHRATNPDKRKSNNWSSKGNTNPYTGKKGTK